MRQQRPGFHRCPVVLLALSLVLAAGCGPAERTDDPGDVPDRAAAAPRPDDGLQINAGVDRAVYAPGDSIRVVLRLRNPLTTPRTITFPTSQRYDVRVLSDDGDELTRWGASRSFAQVTGEEHLEPEGLGPEWTVWIAAPDRAGRYRVQALVPVNGSDLRAELPIRVEEG